MSSELSPQSKRRREIAGLVVLLLTALLFLALVTDGYRGEPRRSFAGISDVPNKLGVAGAMTAGVLSMLVGPAAHVLYFLLCVWGIMLFRHQSLDRFPMRLLGMFLLVGSIAGLLHVNLLTRTDSTAPGGAFGAFVGDHLLRFFGVIGANVIAATLAAVGILLATDFLFVRLFGLFQGLALMVVRWAKGSVQLIRKQWQSHKARRLKRRQPFREVATRILNEEEPVAEAPTVPEGPTERPYSGYSEEEAPAMAQEDLSRILIRTNASPSPSDGPELPTTEVVPPDKTTRRAKKNRDAEPVESRPFEAIAEPPTTQTALDADEEFDAPDFVDDEAEDEADVVAEEAPVAEPPTQKGARTTVSGAQLGLEGLLGIDAANAPEQAVLRCKTTEAQELPPDYEYPKVYTKPPIDLFDPPPARIVTDLTEQLRQVSVHLEETFKTFSIEARVTEVVRGPTITRFELQPAPGTKVSRFHALADDIALALKAQGVRVVAPIPGKGRVGVEIPNKEPEPVVVRELFESESFRHSKARLNLALGKDIAGDAIDVDLSKMPHLLVAGATGAGKTVCIKTFLASLLFSNTPDDLQFVLIDPKMVELSIFNDIPHLVTPVVTDPRKASTALNWLINEMEERYKLFAHLRVRNIEVYNERVENGEIEMVAPTGGSQQSFTVNRKLPYIVCIIDELADLMMLARAEVEGAIARLAQLARATGIHLIIATQRPSVDVLTGVIKANFPARMSFQVSSRVDSRCILDEIGAEHLIGRGDMLYLPAGRSKPVRVQGAFVSDLEMESLITYLKTQAPPQYRDEVQTFGEKKESKENLVDETDELFDDAVRVVLETGQASISMVQRRLRVGYTRAARLIDMMELKGIVGPHTGSKAREILTSLPRSEDEVA